MNLLTITRLVCNLMLSAGAALLILYAISGRALEPTHLLAIGVLALAGGGAQFVVSIIRPRTIRPAWDEQTVASHRGSYQFAYWIALIGFWIFLAADVQSAFLWTGVILICAPSVWMAIATLMGRAG